MAAQEERNPLKRRKDEIQVTALLDAVRGRMPQYTLDEAFEAAVPAELQEFYAAWKQLADATSAPAWSSS